jgi:membrane-bound lytic murein transglycosylase B
MQSHKTPYKCPVLTVYSDAHHVTRPVYNPPRLMLMTFFSRSLRTVTIVSCACVFVAQSACSTQPPQQTSASPDKKAQQSVPTQKTNRGHVQQAPKKPVAPPIETDFRKRPEWSSIEVFIDDMVSKHGFDQAQLLALFSNVRYSARSVNLVKPAPPGKPKDWDSYRARFIEPIRIRNGIEFWHEHADALSRAEQIYGVPAEIIVAIIGVETRYGRYTGNFRIMDVLTTLAFNYPETANRTSRMAFFNKELEQTLLLARESQVEPLSLLGSFAGAIGLPQFMPGSIRAYAVDFDGNGLIDLRTSPVDAIGSVANFLKMHGWERGLPTVFPANVPDQTDDRAWKAFLGLGLKATLTLEELQAAHVTSPLKLPDDLRYGLVDLQNAQRPTEYWLATNNFFAVTHYNRSYFYAMSVIDFSQVLRAKYDEKSSQQ